LLASCTIAISTSWAANALCMCRRHITHAERRREDLNSKLRQTAIHTALINNYYGCYNILHSSSYLQMLASTPWCKLKHKSTLLIDQEVVFDHIYTFEPILLHPSAQQGSRRSKQRESSRLSKGYPRLAHVWGVSLQLPTLFFLYLSSNHDHKILVHIRVERRYI
jgi:hypothetical protein